MLNQNIKNAVASHWRMALIASATVALSACVATPIETSSSSVAAVSSSSAAVSSSVPVSSSSVALSSSSMAPVSSSSVAISSSSVVSSSSIAVSSSSVASSSVANSSSSAASVAGCDGDEAKGKAFFEASNCTLCHGALNDNGTTKGGISRAINPANTDFKHDNQSTGLDLKGYIATYMAVHCSDSSCAGDIATYLNTKAGFCAVTEPEPEERPYTIEKIGCNDPDDYSGDATVIFNGSGQFNGAFFNKDFNSAAYQNLSRPGYSSDYVLSQNSVADASCTNRKVHTGTWLKKLGDWSGQHSNGVNASVNRKIGDIDSIVLELRINSALTDVPTKSEIAALYGSKLNQTGLDRLDDGKVAFALTLNNPDDTTGVRGEVFIDIDQGLYADQWIRITVPKDKLVFWTAENWTKTPVSLSTANAATATSIYMNPETKGNDGPANYGNVVRNILNVSADADWAALNITEDFKEMNISIRNFEIRYDPTDGNVQTSSSVGASSSSGSTSSAGTGAGCGAGQLFCENFNNLSGSNLPSGLEYVDCDGGTASYSIKNGALEVKSGGQGCGGWVKLKSLESKSSAYVKFDATQVQPGSGNKWFMLVGNGNYTALNVESMRMRIFNDNNLIWNVGNFGDTLAPEPFTPAGVATTVKFNAGDKACFELFYDNQQGEIKIWKNGVLVPGLGMASAANSEFQNRWYNAYTGFKPNVKHVHLGGGGSSGMVMSFDNIVVSNSRIGCN